MTYLLRLLILGILVSGLGINTRLTAQPEAAGDRVTGILVTIQSGKGGTDSLVLSNIWFYGGIDTSPTPFLPAGPYTATWDGFVSVDIRGEYRFEAELQGDLKVEINGQSVLEGKLDNGTTEPGKPIRLNKGANPIKVTFKSPEDKGGRVRLYWIPRGETAQPIPNEALSYASNPALAQQQVLRRGRSLFLENRCQQCHDDAGASDALPEHELDAPTFASIGSRRQIAWMEKWILDPHGQREQAQMPKVLHGPDAKKNAAAIAAYLGTLKGETVPALPDGKADSGKALFETLYCGACHSTPESSDKNPELVSLAHVSEKFSAGALGAFLKQPDKHYAWIRMPNFKLSDQEAADLAAYLGGGKSTPANPEKPANDQVVLGEKLIQTEGCINCHASEAKNQFKTKALAELALGTEPTGCLVTGGNDNRKAPEFNFSKEESAALLSFMKSDRESLKRHVPMEYAARYAHKLNCTSCHGKHEEFPAFAPLGGKLKPEWAQKFIAGEVPYKPRHWIQARMPAFPKYAEGLAKGMANEHGYPAKTPEEGPIDEEAAKIGRTLVSTVGGFACVTCHGVGEFGATQVFESNGINLAYSSERLLKTFYHRWLLNPIAIDPRTKMPVYFESEGGSPLSEYYNGDGKKQIEAIWQYIRKGKNMEAPPTQ